MNFNGKCNVTEIHSRVGKKTAVFTEAAEGNNREVKGRIRTL